MSPKHLKNGMKPSLFSVQISKILPGGLRPLNPKALPRLFLDPSYGPGSHLQTNSLCAALTIHLTGMCFIFKFQDLLIGKFQPRPWMKGNLSLFKFTLLLGFR